MSQSAGHLEHLTEVRKAPQDAEQKRARAELDGPGREHRVAEARADDLGEETLGGTGAERDAEAAREWSFVHEAARDRSTPPIPSVGDGV